jgi:hypothetical protein
MTAFNIVRFRVKPGREKPFEDAHRNIDARLDGLRRAHLVKTGDRTYCFIGEWDDRDSLVGARPEMIAILDRFRNDLEDLGSGLGVTDPVSGEVAVDIR